MICVIGALKDEISGIKQNVAIQKRFHKDSATFYRGSYNGIEIVLVRSGVGQEPAKRAVSNAQNMFHLRSIISIGFAGGVIPGLKISDLILAENIYSCDNEDLLFSFNKIPLNKIEGVSNGARQINSILSENRINFKSGNILTINKVADSAKFKEWIGKNYPLSAVEMETAAVAKIAANEGTSFISLRSISDEVSQSLIQTSEFIDKNGAVNKARACLYLLTHPSIIPRAVELKNSVSKAAKALTEAVLTILRHDSATKG